MLKSIEINNFRAFAHLSVDGLSRLNLFIGRNNVGKTCLLEGLFLHLGGHNPEISVRLNVLRGMKPVLTDTGETWGWLFHKRKIEEPVVVTSNDTDGCWRELRVSLRSGGARIKAEDGGVPAEGGKLAEPSSTSRSLGELVLAFTQDGQASEAKAVLEPDGVRCDPGADSFFPNSFLLSTRHRSEKELAGQFGKIEEQLREGEVLETLQIVEPRLRRLAIGTSAGTPSLRADIGIGRLIPLSLLGEGAAHVASIILAILSANGGCVLVDEIENGIHHSIHENIWEALLLACRKADVQLFATTHSRECALAAHHAFAKSLDFDYEFAAYRLERKKGPGVTEAVRLSRETLETAEELGWEVR